MRRFFGQLCFTRATSVGFFASGAVYAEHGFWTGLAVSVLLMVGASVGFWWANR